MKPFYPLITITIGFIVLMLLFRFWIDTLVLVAVNCRNTVETTATLSWKTQVGSCHWLVDGDSRVSEHWYNCDQYEPGQTIPWKKTVYTCE